MEPWLQIGITVFGSGIAAYLAISLKIERQEGRISRLEGDVGNGESGMRATVQGHAIVIAEHEVRLNQVERRVP